VDHPNDQAPGAPSAPASAAAHPAPLGGRVTQDAILDALGRRGLVPLTLCPADAGGRGRPYPDMVLEAFVRTKAAEDVRQVAVVGDTSYDVLSGVRAGAGVVAGVRTGAHGDDAFRAAGATHVLDSVAGLPALLLGGR
jgi:phosphoglycolate phosphatase-like HAD superfamily hydrolase